MLAMIVWRLSFPSQRKRVTETIEHERRLTLRNGFGVIDLSWNIIANGANTIFFTQLESLRDHMGEVGMHFFDTAFPTDSMEEEIDFKVWVRCWIRYLDCDEDNKGGKDDAAEQAALLDAGMQSARSTTSHFNQDASNHNSNHNSNTDHSTNKSTTSTRKKAQVDEKHQEYSFWILRTFKNAYTMLR
jgi:hypothetical protein